MVADCSRSGTAARFGWRKRIGETLGNTRGGDRVFSAVDFKWLFMVVDY